MNQMRIDHELGNDQVIAGLLGQERKRSEKEGNTMHHVS
jgi:hypothetical protein